MNFDIQHTKHLTFAQIEEELKYFERKLIGRSELRVEYTGESAWHLNFDETPGVYAAFEEDEIVYVGETQNIRTRLYELRDTGQHFLRQKRREEDLPMEWLSFSSIFVRFGRKEIEEYMIRVHQPMYNVHGKRRR